MINFWSFGLNKYIRDKVSNENGLSGQMEKVIIKYEDFFEAVRQEAIDMGIHENVVRLICD